MTVNKFEIVPPPVDSPMPTVWSERVRGSTESALDCESAASLACHLAGSFTRAKSWAELLAALTKRGFGLQFEDTRLVLVNDNTGVSLCTCASLGHSFATLMARLGKPSVMADTHRVVERPQA
jgi:hypothetical protein